MKHSPALSSSISASAAAPALSEAVPKAPAVPPDLEFAGLKAQYAGIRDDVARRIEAVLDHGMYVMGPEVAELETALAELAGCKHAIGVSSGTDALLAALMAKNIGPGDAVFLPAFTFTATAEVVMLLGANPVFVDVEDRSFNIDPEDLKQRVEEVKNEGALHPRAVIAVDLFGLPADYTILNEICDAHHLFLLADAAQSFGGARDGRKVGSMAPVTATSFFPAKPLGCYGDGGAIFTESDTMAGHLRSIRIHGQGDVKYDIMRLGLNARLDSMQAAVLLTKIPRSEAEVGARLGGLMLDLGRGDDAEARLREALLLSREIEDRRGETLSSLWLGILLWENHEEDARPAIDRSTLLARETGFRRAEALARAILARIHLTFDDVPAALEQAARAVELLEVHGSELNDRIVITGSRALTLRAAGQVPAAMRLIDALERRMRRQNRRMASAGLRRTQRTYTARLLEALDDFGAGRDRRHRPGTVHRGDRLVRRRPGDRRARNSGAERVEDRHH